MSKFRNAVLQVQEDAKQGDLHALGIVLNDLETERAARLFAANALGRAGQSGHRILLETAMVSDTLGKFAALRAYLLNQEQLDEKLLLQSLHSKTPRIRRGMKRLLQKLPFPINDEFRLRCHLPEPYCYAEQMDDSLARWLTPVNSDWYAIVSAIRIAKYEPAIPLLINVLRVKPHHTYTLVFALASFGAKAIPYLLHALPESSEPQRSGILRALWHITRPGLFFPEGLSPVRAEWEDWLRTEFFQDADAPFTIFSVESRSVVDAPPARGLIQPSPKTTSVAKPGRFAALIARIKRFLSE